LAAAEQRTLLLLRALRSFYLGLGAFATAAFTSLLGAVMVPLQYGILILILEVFGVLVGLVAVSCLVFGSVLLVHETRIAVRVISERAASIRDRVRGGQSMLGDGENNL
jgi:hypothetical protein